MGKGSRRQQLDKGPRLGSEMDIVLVSGGIRRIVKNCKIIPCPGEKIDGREIVIAHVSGEGPKVFYYDSQKEEDGNRTLTEEVPSELIESNRRKAG